MKKIFEKINHLGFEKLQNQDKKIIKFNRNENVLEKLKQFLENNNYDISSIDQFDLLHCETIIKNWLKFAKNINKNSIFILINK